MSTKKEEIVGTMTIKEAAANWEDPRRQHLKRWGETFGVPLQELHPGHVVTYQNDRGDETTAAQVDAEVSALLALLKQIGPWRRDYRRRIQGAPRDHPEIY